MSESFGLWGGGRAIGGLNWPALVRTSLEAMIGGGLSVGLVVLFREVVRRPRRLLAAMAIDSYPAYILHLYIVVGLQVAILGAELPVFVKFALVAALGILLSFAVAHLSQWVPGVRVILGTHSGARGGESLWLQKRFAPDVALETRGRRHA